MTFISNNFFWFKHIKKLDRVDEFDSEIGYTTECDGDVGCNATKILPILSRWASIG